MQKRSERCAKMFLDPDNFQLYKLIYFSAMLSSYTLENNKKLKVF